MTFLKIQDAPLKTSIVGDEKIPTGGYGDLAISVQQIKDFTSLAFSNVDNTSDANKPISVATQAALDLKANVSDVNTSLALKSDKTYVDDQLALKASKIYVDTELQKTASKTYVDNQLATKASTTYVDSINSTKASISYVDSELALKSDITYVDSALANKTHNSLVGRDVANAHPASVIFDESGKTQQEINDTKTVLLAKLYGLVGDGSNEYTALKSLLDLSSTLKLPVDLCGLTISTSNITATGNIKLVGSGEIKLFAGSNGTLLTTAYDLVIDGDITLDQDKINNSGGTVTAESHATISHSGATLILRNGVNVKPSASNNIVTRATKSLLLDDVEIDGGMIGLYAIVPNAKVTLRGGEYKNSTLYDNIAIYNAEDVYISGVTSHDSTRSGIVVNNTSKKCRIIGNLCYANKKDISNQGGWGIVLSVNALDCTVSANVCLGNQTGGITLDTFPAQGVESLDNRITVAGNTINGLYTGTYSTTGISLNDATHAVVTGNSIYKVGQGIATDSAHFANITGNTIQDVTSYFVQLYRSNDATVNSNTCDGCSNTSGGAISVADSSRFNIANNTVVNLTGSTGNAVRVSGTCTDWLVQNNKITRAVSGSGFVFHILGAANIGGVIKGNIVRALLTDAWQWAIVSDNSAQFSTHDNIFTGINSGIARYIYQGANATAGNDTVNGLFNSYTSEPTWKTRTGQVATISGVVKTYNGTAWINATGASASVTYDPPSIAAGASVTTTVTLTGAVVGSFVQATFNQYNADIEISSVVSAANTVTVKFKNTGNGVVDLASGTLTVKLI